MSILVSRSTREHVHAARQVHTNLRRTAIANEVDGKLQVHEISPEHEAHAQKVLRRIVDGIDSFCEVVPVIGPAWLSDSVATLIRLADAPTRDTLLLCIERNAVLVSDD